VYRARVAIQYVGAPECDIPAAHGNSLLDRPFIRTNPTVLEHMKKVARDTGGSVGPAKLYKEAVRTAETDDQRACPRNVKQVRIKFEPLFSAAGCISIHLSYTVNMVKHTLNRLAAFMVLDYKFDYCVMLAKL